MRAGWRIKGKHPSNKHPPKQKNPCLGTGNRWGFLYDNMNLRTNMKVITVRQGTILFTLPWLSYNC